MYSQHFMDKQTEILLKHPPEWVILDNADFMEPLWGKQWSKDDKEELNCCNVDLDKLMTLYEYIAENNMVRFYRLKKS